MAVVVNWMMVVGNGRFFWLAIRDLLFAIGHVLLFYIINEKLMLNFNNRIKIELLLIVFSFFLLLLFRGSAIFYSNQAHIFLLKYLLQDDRVDEQLHLARESFLHAYNSRQAPRSTVWRLSYIDFQLRKYETAINFFAEAKEQNPPDFLLTSHISEFYFSEEYLILNALAAEKTAPSLSLNLYRQAFALEPQEWPLELYQRYYSLLANSDDPIMQSFGQNILQYFPWDSTDETLFEGLDRNTPPLPVITNEAINSCWELMQIRYDRTALEYGPLLPVIFTWRSKLDPLYEFNQSQLVVNLAPNAGFEWGQQDGKPQGYSTPYTKDNFEPNYQLCQSSILSTTTKVGALLNSEQLRNTSYASSLVPINTSQIYFQGGWIKSEKGGGGLGHRLRGDLEGIEVVYQEVISDVRNNDWMFFGKMMILPDQTETVNLWAVNSNSSGEVFFDDLLFFELKLPACEKP